MSCLHLEFSIVLCVHATDLDVSNEVRHPLPSKPVVALDRAHLLRIESGESVVDDEYLLHRLKGCELDRNLRPLSALLSLPVFVRHCCNTIDFGNG